MKQNSISFYTLGCRLNQSETAVIQKTFESDDYKIVRFDEPADIAVINTCTVTENGDADTRRLVNRVNRINPNVQIALIGCQAQVQKRKLTKLPNVKWVVGNAVKMDLKSILRELKDETNVVTPSIPKKEFTLPATGTYDRLTRANLKIQDGCDFFCSFCEIPYARGRARSRKFNDILKEAKALIEAGHKELVLTGINLGTYRNNGKTFLNVIDALEQFDSLERIRISSIEPTTIPKKLIKKMAAQSKLCRYLHIPLQSADDKILKSMKRKYTVKEFTDFIQFAKKTVEKICVGTDIIVGFPGETDQTFESATQRLKDMPIDYFHVFSYSQRELAKSKYLKNTVNTQIIKKRSKILRRLSDRKRQLFYQTLIGTKQTVLFEQKKDGLWSGLTDHYVRVSVKTSKSIANALLPVKITTLDNQIAVANIV